MAGRTDHFTRDAQHACRGYISMGVSPYIRRMQEQGYAHIAEEGTKNDKDKNATAVGIAAAQRALAAYNLPDPGAVNETIAPALPAGDDV
jgi:hypothetical protein